MMIDTKFNEAILTVEFEKLLPDFRRFAATKAVARQRGERLQSVHGDSEYLHATDSHRAIRIKRDYVEGLPDGSFNYDVRENEYKAPDFPEMARLYPEHFNEELELPFARLKEVRDALKIVYDDVRARKVENNAVKLSVSGGNLTLKARDDYGESEGAAETIEDIFSDQQAEFSLWMNARLLRDALLTASKLRRNSDSSGIILCYISDKRPFVLTDGALYEMILMPVRVW